MRFKVCLMTILAAALLSGCQTTQTFSEMDAAQQKALIQTYRSDCKASGYRRGTNAFARCVQKSVIKRDRSIDLARAATMAGVGACGPGYPQDRTFGICF
jgi:uncharacterized paraquat-inducible protein A